MADEQLSEGSSGYDLTAVGDVVWLLADRWEPENEAKCRGLGGIFQAKTNNVQS